MRAEMFNNCEHAPLLMDWWFKHRGTEFNPNLIAQHGIVVKDSDSKPLCLCFLYFPSNSKLCQMAFITRNPWIEPHRAGKAIKLLVSFAVHACKSLGYNSLYSASENVTIQRLLESNEFFVGEVSSREFFKEL